MRHFKAPDLLAQGSGERSPLVAEQFTFQQPGGNRRAIQTDERKIPPRTHAVNGARHQFLAGAGLAQDQYRRVGGRHYLHLPHYALQRRAGPDNFFEVLRDREGLLFDILLPVSLPQVGYEGDPAEGTQFQDGRRHQHRNACPVLANQFFFKGRAGAEAQPFFVRKLIQPLVFLGREVGPHQPAGRQILAAITDEIEKRVIGFGDAVKLAGHYAGDGGLGRHRANTVPAAPQFLISFVAVAKVPYHPGEALQVSVLVLQGHGDDVGPESRAVFSYIPAFVTEMAVARCPFQFFLHLAGKLVFFGIEHRYVSADGLAAGVLVYALSTAVPGDDIPVHIQ